VTSATRLPADRQARQGGEVGVAQGDDCDEAGKPAEPARESHRASWHVLGQRAFQIYFAGSLISNLGTWLQNTAQMLLAYRLTHSAFAVGLVSCAQFSGFLVMAPLGARFSARVGGQRLLLASQMASAAIAAAMAALYFFGMMTETWLIAGAFAIGLAFAVATPVQAAMVSRLVPPGDTRAALAMNSVSYNAGRTLAPALAIAVLLGIGAGGAFALNAVSFAIFAIAIGFLQPSAEESAAGTRVSFSSLRMALQKPRMWLLLFMVASITLAEDPVLVLGPTVAHQLGGQTSWAAYFLSALGAGTVVGSLIRIKQASSRKAALSLLVLAVSMFAFVNIRLAPVTVVAAVAAGAAGLLTGSAAQSLLLKTAGAQRATQVMALWAIAWAGSKPIASIADGWIASHHHLFWASVWLVGPALLIAVGELCMPKVPRRWAKKTAYRIGDGVLSNVR
jgi:predicted MFS family arabinose efflux permease